MTSVAEMHPGDDGQVHLRDAYKTAAFRLQGRLDVAALSWAFSAIVARHEILRTSFREVAGRTVQWISDDTEFQLPLVDYPGRHCKSHRRCHHCRLEPLQECCRFLHPPFCSQGKLRWQQRHVVAGVMG